MEPAVIVALLNLVPGLITLAVAILAKKQIGLLEKNTNSIKDALVDTTARANMAEGLAQGRSEQKAETRADAERGD